MATSDARQRVRNSFRVFIVASVCGAHPQYTVLGEPLFRDGGYSAPALQRRSSGRAVSTRAGVVTLRFQVQGLAPSPV
jgi:hypothetical protein